MVIIIELHEIIDLCINQTDGSVFLMYAWLSKMTLKKSKNSTCTMLPCMLIIGLVATQVVLDP